MGWQEVPALCAQWDGRSLQQWETNASAIFVPSPPASRRTLLWVPPLSWVPTAGDPPSTAFCSPSLKGTDTTPPRPGCPSAPLPRPTSPGASRLLPCWCPRLTPPAASILAQGRSSSRPALSFPEAPPPHCPLPPHPPVMAPTTRNDRGVLPGSINPAPCERSSPVLLAFATRPPAQ